jgi:hypothetical protein
MSQYTKNPVTIEAFRWTGGPDQQEDPVWACEAIAAGTIQFVEAGFMSVHTTEGVMNASPGDWIIRGVEGEIYPCRDSVFQATYVAGDAVEQKHHGLPVPGYRPQSEANILISKVNKELEERCIRQAEAIRDMPGMDARMAAPAITNLQQAFMWLNRAAFQSGRVALPEDKATAA